MSDRLLFVFRVVLISVYCLTSISSGFSQNYMLFERNRTMNFARLNHLGEDSIYYFMKITGEEVTGEDTTWYFNTQLRTPVAPSPDCFLENKDTVILGSRVLILNDTDRTHVFFNRQNDSIFIKTQVVVGNTWKFYTWSNGTYVKATVINKLEGVLVGGEIDSFYRIKLNVFTAGGTLLADTFPNETKIDFSKTYGLIEFFDFNIFPNPGDSLGRVLRGLSNPDIGIVDIDAQTAFEFETGYEFHFREEMVPDLESDADARIRAWKYFVMEKEIDPLGATYTMERIQFDTVYTDGVPATNIIWDTVIVHYDFADYAFLDTIEFNVMQNTQYGYADWVSDHEVYSGVAHKNVYDWYDYDEASGCLGNPDDISNPRQTYGQGLGTMLYIDSTDTNNYYKLEMVYFKQGLTVYGTPYDFSALDNPVVNFEPINRLMIYPIPATDVIHIEQTFPESGMLTISDIYGKTVLAESGATNPISITSLPAGYYTITITHETGVWQGKLIKL